MKPASVRFYVDADILGLGRLLAQLRSDVTFPGDQGATIRKRHRRPCPIADPATLDPEWMPVVANEGWLTVTRDSRITRSLKEVRVLMDSGLKLVAIAGPDAKTTWDQLEVVMRHWRRVEELAELPGPFAYSLTYKSGLRRVH